MNRSIQTILICFLSLFFIFFLWNPEALAKTDKKWSVDDEYQQIHRETDVMKIMSVLEKRVGDQKLLEKAKEKLSTLRGPEFSLITSLSEQITKEGDRPGVDIAFLLLTALIIFS
jgi:hypothetical protein